MQSYHLFFGPFVGDDVQLTKLISVICSKLLEIRPREPRRNVTHYKSRFLVVPLDIVLRGRSVVNLLTERNTIDQETAWSGNLSRQGEDLFHDGYKIVVVAFHGPSISNL